MLLAGILCYSYRVHRPTTVLNKIKFMTSINLLQVSAPGCHPQGVFQIKGIQAQHANLSMHRTHWND
jgi:hypothetical protein